MVKPYAGRPGAALASFLHTPPVGGGESAQNRY